MVVGYALTGCAEYFIAGPDMKGTRRVAPDHRFLRTTVWLWMNEYLRVEKT